MKAHTHQSKHGRHPGEGLERSARHGKHFPLHRAPRNRGGGVDDAEEDLRSEPEARTNAREIDREAEARKHGGRTRRERKRGGHIKPAELHEHEHETRHARKCGCQVKHAHAKHVGLVAGEHAKVHAGRKPRNSGGRAGCEASPFTSAHKGLAPKGRGGEHVE